MRLVTISNLYPRPDQPTRGLFNFQLFREVGKVIGIQNPESRIQNVCLVPEWRVWRWPAIRKWTALLPTAHPGLHSLGDAGPTVYLPVFYLPLLGRSLNWWFYYRALRNKGVGFGDGVTCLASWLYPDAVAAARLARELGAPVWLRVHGTDRYHLKNRRRRRLILDAVDYAQGVICNCKAVADDLVKCGITREKIHIIPNGIDTSLFRYRNKEEVLVNGYSLSVNRDENIQQTITDSRSAAGRTILFIGNLVPIKAPDVMLRAFAALGETEGQETEGQVAAAVPAADYQKGSQTGQGIVRRDGERHLMPEDSEVAGVHASLLTSHILPPPLPSLLVIGSGPMRAQLERMARELGIAGRVHFLGNRSHDEVALWMNLADVLCLTSHSEGMPNVVLEALVSGLPVVATDVGACRELLADSSVSRLCKAGDEAGIADALREILRLIPDRALLAQEIAGQGSWEIQARKLINMLFPSSPITDNQYPL